VKPLLKRTGPGRRRFEGGRPESYGTGLTRRSSRAAFRKTESVRSAWLVVGKKYPGGGPRSLVPPIDARISAIFSPVMTSSDSSPVIMPSGDSRLAPSPIPNQAPFEGPEKLLEIWWDAKEPSGDHARDGERRGLRAVPRAEWEAMLDIVRCKVLSVIEGHELDAYLLRWVSPSIASLSRF